MIVRAHSDTRPPAALDDEFDLTAWKDVATGFDQARSIACLAACRMESIVSPESWPSVANSLTLALAKFIA